MDPFSLFSQSGKSSNPFKPKKSASSAAASSAAKPSEPTPVSAPSPSPKPTSIETAIPDEEVQEYITKLRSMTADINEKIIEIQVQSGSDLKEVKKFSENPQNFTKEEWEILQRTKQVIEKQLYNALGQDYKKEVVRHEVSQQDKNRQAKTIAARKKNWISMR